MKTLINYFVGLLGGALGSMSFLMIARAINLDAFDWHFAVTFVFFFSVLHSVLHTLVHSIEEFGFKSCAFSAFATVGTFFNCIVLISVSKHGELPDANLRVFVTLSLLTALLALGSFVAGSLVGARLDK